jgi:hypothetical protein
MGNLYTSIQALQKRLADAGVPSIVIGGVAVGVWGDPRVTRDVDLKVLLGRQDADRLLTILQPGYVSLLPDPKEAIRRQAMLFIEDADKIRLDLLLADTPYDAEAVARGRAIEVLVGVTIIVCSPEDLVIYKLISTRPRDHEDARGVIRRQGDALDVPYISGWLRQFELAFDDSTLIATFRGLLHGVRP